MKTFTRGLPLTLWLSMGGVAITQAAAHPALTGLWTLDQKDFDQAVTQTLPYTPEGQRLADAQKKAVEVDLKVLGESEAKCLPIGMPGFMANEFALEILETPGRVTMLSEASSIPRTIYLDRKAATPGLEPMWNGYSMGHWDGDALVIETTHMNDRVGPITMGGVHSPSTTIVERLHIEQGGQVLVNESTFTDPKYLAQPWTTVHHYHRLAKNAELWEYACEINAAGWSERYAGERPDLTPKP